MTDLLWPVIAILGVVAGVIADRILHRPSRSRLGQVVNRFEQFLDDWDGEPERRTPDGKVVLESRRAGMPERMVNVERDVAEIKNLLNGGGLGAAMQSLDDKFTDHIGTAEASRAELIEDVRETRQFVAEAAAVLTTNQQRIEEQVEALDGKVDGRLFTLEEAERTHRAALHELGLDITDDLDR